MNASFIAPNLIRQLGNLCNEDDCARRELRRIIENVLDSLRELCVSGALQPLTPEAFPAYARLTDACDEFLATLEVMECDAGARRQLTIALWKDLCRTKPRDRQ